MASTYQQVSYGSRGDAAKTTTQFIVYATLSAATTDSVGVDIKVRGYWK